jgi:hypothetical protein
MPNEHTIRSVFIAAVIGGLATVAYSRMTSGKTLAKPWARKERCSPATFTGSAFRAQT